MAILTSASGFPPRRRRGPGRLVFWLLLCLLPLMVFPGCGGCRKTPQQIQAEAEEREKLDAEQRARERARRKEKKPNVEMGKLAAQPYGTAPEVCAYKPGHWTATTLPVKANNFNLLGDLEMTTVDPKGKALGLPGMAYSSTGARQVALPKGQVKLLQSVLYVPVSGRDAFVSSEVKAKSGGRGVYPKGHPLKRMPAYQYHLAVLARWPSKYKYLDSLDSVRHPSDLGGQENTRGYYRVQLVQAEKRTTLPRHALFWTSIGCLLWDDAAPDALLPDQQIAMLDWLHWGGQLIVSGPESLDTAKNSFLSPYLPAQSTGTREISAADLEELNNNWTLPVHAAPGRSLAPVKPWSGVAFEKHPDALEVPGTGGLVVKRRIGRGSIVVSAFSLSNPELTDWPSFDGFFNACLLGRPPRQFLDNDLEVQVAWAEGGFRPFDARVVSQLRYFTRDTGNKTFVRPDESRELAEVGFISTGDDYVDPDQDFAPDVASWDDFNSVANSARESLRVAAQIEIPERMFVVWVVGIYLIVLVPANWAFFRLIGRVEWAWVMAPIIAVVCTIVVVRLAQLDIGFARSLSQISVVETQAGYPRAHVTRYTALYTSLATGYDFRFEDPGAQVQPFSRVADPAAFSFLPGQGLTKLQYRYENDVSMRGFRVTSNDTGMVHSEQMVDLGGPVLLEEVQSEGYRVINHTGLTLHGAGLIRKTQSGSLETAWVGPLEAEESAGLYFQDQPNREIVGGFWTEERNRWPLTASGSSHDELNFRQLVELAENPNSLEPGDVRLIAWSDQRIPGQQISPSAPQTQHATLLVANLRYGAGRTPKPDKNTRGEVQSDPLRAFPGTSFDSTP